MQLKRPKMAAARSANQARQKKLLFLEIATLNSCSTDWMPRQPQPIGSFASGCAEAVHQSTFPTAMSNAQSNIKRYSLRWRHTSRMRSSSRPRTVARSTSTTLSQGKELRYRDLEIWKAGFRETLMKLSSISPRVVVIRDTPINAKQFGTECLETNVPTECAAPRSQAAPADAPDAAVARSFPGIELLDLTDRFCDSKKCPAINDGIVVYRADNNHITATMSLRLQADFAKILAVEH
jgi:hypothetical protein